MADDKKQAGEAAPDEDDEEIEHSSALPAEGNPDAGEHSGISSELPAEG